VRASVSDALKIQIKTVVTLNKKILKISERIVIISVVIIVTAYIVKAADRNFFNDKSASNSGCPAEMIFITAAGGGFCIDKYESSPSSVCPYNNPQNQIETSANLNLSECRPLSIAGAIPWRNISQNQAAAVCAKAGKRLPTGKEWQQAALGTSDKEAGWGIDDCQLDNNWSDQPGQTGSGKNCVSSAGVYDMIGNIWEWTDGTIYEGAYNGKSLPDDGYITSVDEDAMPSAVNSSIPDSNYYNDYFWQKKIGTRGIARGGYWNNKSEGGQYSVYAVNPPSFAGDGVGFRCAK
jgi:hypothetical protein